METPSYHVILTDEALTDLQRIAAHIRKDSPQNASSLAKRIVDTIDSLISMPNRFRCIGKTRKRQSPVHALLIRPYIIYYRVDESQRAVRILTVRHGARKQPRRFG